MANVILCFEDQEVTRSLENLLKMEGHEIRTTNKALEAVHMALTRKVNILLLDPELEGGRGYSLVPIINTLDDDIAVITLTQRDSLELQRLARRGRVFFHAVWPHDKEAILTAVGNAEAVAVKKRIHETGALNPLNSSYFQKGAIEGRVPLTGGQVKTMSKGRIKGAAQEGIPLRH